MLNKPKVDIFKAGTVSISIPALSAGAALPKTLV